jgi:hypothetical protein
MKASLGKMVAGIGGVLAVLAPVGRCPVCMSTAAGLAGSTGLGLLSSKAWFLPLIGAFLLVGLWGTIFSARAHGRWLGVWATALGAALLIAGRLAAQTLLVWTGALLLAGGWLVDLYWKRKVSAVRLVRIAGIQ